jgi:tyrosyl-tRNA synthetase
MQKHRENPSVRYAQTRLAEEVTKLVHGEAAMRTAKRVTDSLTGVVPIGESDDVLAEIRREIPSVVSHETGSIIAALVESGLAASNGEARRLIQAGGVAINGTKTDREEFIPEHFQSGRLLLRRGKAFKDSALVELA